MNDSIRPVYWSVRRELWENRSIYLAPFAVAGVVLFGFMVGSFGLAARRRAALLLDPAQRRAAIEMPYNMAAIVILLTSVLVAIFYSLDALYGERRDRSILFWKSLPVSDVITVLSKAAVPLVILPATAFATIVVTQFFILMMSTAALAASGLAGTTYESFNLIRQSIILLYGLIALALWHAPIYGWLLLVSAWARRAAFLWAFLPLFAICILEQIIFQTHYFAKLLGHRVMGFAEEAFRFGPGGQIRSLSDLTPGSFLMMPGLWLGLIAAALFLAGAVRLRRYREPI